MDVTMVLRKTLKASYIPLCVRDYILRNLRVIRQVPPSVGKVLDNCRVWTGRINDNEPILCGCAAFQWLPKRRVYCPSWEYTGPHVDTINVNIKTKVLPGWEQKDMEMAVTMAWQRWLPESLMPDRCGLDLLFSTPPSGRRCSQREVAHTKKVSAPMVVTPINTCNPCVMVTSHLHGEVYIAAFSEASDPNHFAKVYDSEDEARQFLWDSYT